MSKTNIIGIVLLVAVLIGYSLWMAPTKEERIALQQRADSIRRVQIADSIANAILLEEARAIEDSLSKIQAETDSITRPFAINDTLSDKLYTFENDDIKLKIAAKGGRIWSAQLKPFVTYDSLPLILFEGNENEFGFDISTADLRIVNTNDLIFEPFSTEGDSVFVSGQGITQFSVRYYPEKNDSTNNSYIEYIYTMEAEGFNVDFDIKFVNMQKYFARNMIDIPLKWKTTLLQQEKNLKNELAQTTVFYMNSANEVDKLKPSRKEDKYRTSGEIKWISYKQQFFSCHLIADNTFTGAEVSVKNADNSNRELKEMQTHLLFSLDNANNQEYNMRWLFAPTKYKIMRGEKLNLERQIPLGWEFFLMQWINRGPVLLIFNWLESFNLNYGIIILILTIFIKLLLLPIAYKTYMSRAKQRVLRPEIEEINKKYPKQEDAVKKQQATMDLYKRAGVNPMSGCVPMLLQLPILIALFRFFPSSFELRQQSFLWATDLSSYDSILDLPFNIPFYGDHVSLFTLLMTISTVIYTYINNKLMGTSSQQMPGMKFMMYLMPIMFLGLFNNFSSGLSYYYLLTNLFSFLQMFIFYKVVDEDKLHKRLQENKKKPAKRSSFQKRLDEAMKMQQKSKR